MCFQFLNSILEIKLLLYQSVTQETCGLLLFAQELKQFKNYFGGQKDTIGCQLLQGEGDPVQHGHQELGQGASEKPQKLQHYSQAL